MIALRRLFRGVCWLWLLLLVIIGISQAFTPHTSLTGETSVAAGLVLFALPGLLGLFFLRRKNTKPKRNGETRLLRHSRGYSTPVVGTSFRQKDLLKVAGPKKERGKKIKCFAALVCEDDNPEDPNAVMVLIDQKHVGYLPREDVEEYRKELLTLDNSLPNTKAMAIVTGGWKNDQDEGDFGVKLNIKRPLEWAKKITKAS